MIVQATRINTDEKTDESIGEPAQNSYHVLVPRNAGLILSRTVPSYPALLVKNKLCGKVSPVKFYILSVDLKRILNK
jgi:hypothetical protein